MKQPQRPPPEERLRALAPQVLVRTEPLDDERYLHWDDLRRRQPPPNLDHETWWAALKLARTHSRRVLPTLQTATGRPFSWNTTDRIMERLHHIDLWAGGHVGLHEPQDGIAGSAATVIANKETQGQYVLSSLITEAITSSQLEGASTTREVAQEMLFERRKPRTPSERMILNNFLTMQHIGELRSRPLTPDIVFELHRLVTTDTLDKADAAGRFRRSDEKIAVVDNDDEVLHDPPPADQLAERLRAMCDFANGKTPHGFMHPVVRAIVLHFWLAYDHPFVDGNGRTARALFYWSMLRAGYWLFEYLSISEIILRAPTRYGRAFLLCETDDEDLTYFLAYHLEVIGESVDTLRRFIAAKADTVRALDAVLRGAADRFNHRQRELLSHALRHPAQVYTVAGHQARQAVVYETARSDLLGLAEAGLLLKSQAQKRLHFRPAPDLERRLKRLAAEHDAAARLDRSGALSEHPGTRTRRRKDG